MGDFVNVVAKPTKNNIDKLVPKIVIGFLDIHRSSLVLTI